MAGIEARIEERVKKGNKRATHVVRGRRDGTATDIGNYEDADNLENRHPNYKRAKLSSANSNHNDGNGNDDGNGRDGTLIECSSTGYGDLYHVDATGGILNQRQSHLAATGVRLVDWSSMSNVMEDCRNCTLLQHELEEYKIRIRRLEKEVEFHEDENRLLRIENQQLKAGNKSELYIEPTYSRVTQMDEGNLSDVRFVDDSSLEGIPEGEAGDSDNDCNENRTVVANNEQVEPIDQVDNHEGKENEDQSQSSREVLHVRGRSQDGVDKTGPPEGKSPEAAHTGQKSGKKLKNCGFCGKGVSDLGSHMKTHTREKPYPCNVCDRAFSYANNLKVHQQRIHSGERPYKCRTCELAFSTSANLKVHERIHSGERPYKCRTCELAFSTSYNLKVHERIHSGERPYKCRTCELAFSTSSALKKHERIHSGERPYECQYCDSSIHSHPRSARTRGPPAPHANP